MFIDAEAARRAQGQRRPGDRPSRGKVGATSRRNAVSAVGAGHTRRRTQSNSQYQYTLQGDNLERSERVGATSAAEAATLPELRDANTDQQNHGLEATSSSIATPPRAWASRRRRSTTPYDAFGQRQVSTMYKPLNQYHVVMEVAPQFYQQPRCAAKHLCSLRTTARRSRCPRSLTTAHPTHLLR